MTPHQKLRGQKKISTADAELRDFLRKMFASKPQSRAQLAEALEEQLGEHVSLARLESFIAPTKESARLPAYFVRALAEVLDDDGILLFLARPSLRKEIEFVEYTRKLQSEFIEHVRDLRRIASELLDRAGK